MLQSDLLQWLSLHLVKLGPVVIFVACLLETAVFAGLILPVGALIAFAAVLSSRGLFDPAEVVAFALLGALAGDQIGFMVGRWFAPGPHPAGGGIATLWRGALRRTESLVRTRGILALTVARAIPFVRTVMPWFAGRSGITWWRFLLFDSLGVLLWGSIYTGSGFLVGAGWRELAARYGEVAGALLLAAALLAIIAILRTRIRRQIRRAAGHDVPSAPAEDIPTL